MCVLVYGVEWVCKVVNMKYGVNGVMMMGDGECDWCEWFLELTSSVVVEAAIEMRRLLMVVELM